MLQTIMPFPPVVTWEGCSLDSVPIQINLSPTLYSVPYSPYTGWAWQAEVCGSENSAFDSVESAPGNAKSQEEDILSLCLQAQAGLAFFGL